MTGLSEGAYGGSDQGSSSAGKSSRSERLDARRAAKREKRERKLQKRRWGIFVPPEPLPDPAIADVVFDGTLVALASVRLAVKNIVLVRALRDRADYDDSFYLGAIRDEVESLAREKEHDADRVSSTLEAVRHKVGRGESPHDHRAVDLDIMHRRVTTLRAMAVRLREIRAEDRAIGELLAAARANALDEIASNIARVHEFQTRSPLTAEQRASALNGLVNDLRRSLRALDSPLASDPASVAGES